MTDTFKIESNVKSKWGQCIYYCGLNSFHSTYDNVDVLLPQYRGQTEWFSYDSTQVRGAMMQYFCSFNGFDIVNGSWAVNCQQLVNYQTKKKN